MILPAPPQHPTYPYATVRMRPTATSTKVDPGKENIFPVLAVVRVKRAKRKLFRDASFKKRCFIQKEMLHSKPTNSHTDFHRENADARSCLCQQGRRGNGVVRPGALATISAALAHAAHSLSLLGKSAGTLNSPFRGHGSSRRHVSGALMEVGPPGAKDRDDERSVSPFRGSELLDDKR